MVPHFRNIKVNSARSFVAIFRLSIKAQLKFRNSTKALPSVPRIFHDPFATIFAVESSHENGKRHRGASKYDEIKSELETSRSINVAGCFFTG